MHNLHLITVKADSHEDAQSSVESGIGDWGNENNWRTIIGSIREDNDVDFTGEGRGFIDKDITIEKLNSEVTEWINEGSLYAPKNVDVILKDIDNATTHELWQLSKHFKHLYQQKCTEGCFKDDNGFNILEHTFKDWTLDECGVTDISHYNDDGDHSYVVFIDMHS